MIEILALTIDDVLKDGFDDTLILKSGETIRILDYDLLSKEREHLQALRREYIAFKMPRFTPVISTEQKVFPLNTKYSLQRFKPPINIEQPEPLSTSLRELLEQVDTPQPYLIEGIIPKGEFVGIVGKSGVNKSTFCRQLCLSIATQQTTFCGFPLLPKHGKALYVFSEDGLSWLRRYLRKNSEGISHTKEQLENMRIANMNEFEDGYALISFLDDELTLQSYDLIVLDSFSDFLTLMGAKLNDNSDVREAVRSLNFLKTDGCCIMFNHHISDKVKDIGSFQGATAFKQIVRTLIEITEKDNQRVISLEKNSYGEKFEPMVFNLTDNFLFQETGETMTRSELSEHVANSNFSAPKAPNRPKVAPCDQDTVKDVFRDSDTLQTGEIIRRLYLKHSISEATAKRWITDVLALGYILKSGHGVYELPKVSKVNSLRDTFDTTFDTMTQDTENKEVGKTEKSIVSLGKNTFDTMGIDTLTGEILPDSTDDLPPRFKIYEQFEGANL